MEGWKDNMMEGLKDGWMKDILDKLKFFLKLLNITAQLTKYTYYWIYDVIQ